MHALPEEQRTEQCLLQTYTCQVSPLKGLQVPKRTRSTALNTTYILAYKMHPCMDAQSSHQDCMPAASPEPLPQQETAPGLHVQQEPWTTQHDLSREHWQCHWLVVNCETGKQYSSFCTLPLPPLALTVVSSAQKVVRGALHNSSASHNRGWGRREMLCIKPGLERLESKEY